MTVVKLRLGLLWRLIVSLVFTQLADFTKLAVPGQDIDPGQDIYIYVYSSRCRRLIVSRESILAPTVLLLSLSTPVQKCGMLAWRHVDHHDQMSKL